jgi:hypothetical protein
VLGITAFTWLVVVCLTLSETSPLAVLALWLPVIATEALWRVTDHAAASPVDLTHSLPRPSSPSSPSSAESLVQQLTRTRENGQERVSGKARIEFAAGEQTTALHVVFCPPLDHDPEVDVEAIDAEEVSVRATECRSYGLRFEVRRGRDAAGPLRVLVQFEASSATG